MTLLKQRYRHMFVNVINELREETHNQKTFIDYWMFRGCQDIWWTSSNRQEAKTRIKAFLGW